MIRDLANEALTDLRGVLGVLRDPGTGELAHAPQPTWSDLPSLVDHAREAGLHVVLSDRLPRDAPVPDVVGRTLYRIVQEGITNAGKHAPGAVVRIEVTGSPEDGRRHRAAQPARVRADADAGLGPGADRSHRARRAPGWPARGAPGGAAVRAARLDTVGRLVNVTRLLIVDDDPLVRSALTFMLGGQPDLEVVGEAGDGREGVARAAELKPDVVLMDIRMPRLNGLDATRRLLASDDPPRVIVLTTFDADEYVVEALAAGADGFLLKDTPPPEVVDAIRKVAQGDPMLSPAVTRSLIRRVATSNRAPAAVARLAELTDREREVALAVGRGLSNADIAAELYLSVPTVKAHVSRLFDKLGVTNRVQIAMCVHDAGLI